MLQVEETEFDGLYRYLPASQESLEPDQQFATGVKNQRRVVLLLIQIEVRDKRLRGPVTDPWVR